MDTYRGSFYDRDDDSGYDDEPEDDDFVAEGPPALIGQDERRLQVRAYNHWASLLGSRRYPSVEDLDLDALSDFGPLSILLDFTAGTDRPVIAYLGQKLADECEVALDVMTMADIPPRSLLSRISDHYMQIFANGAPIGFEAEFVNQHDKTLLYRGILLPFSTDDESIDFIYCVINWKELADQKTTEALMREVDIALAERPLPDRPAEPLAVWADGPLDSLESPPSAGLSGLSDDEEFDEQDADEVLDLAGFASATDIVSRSIFPSPKRKSMVDLSSVEPVPTAGQLGESGLTDAGLPNAAPVPVIVPSMASGLAGSLAAARELAEAARGAEDRTRGALYAAIGRAYDFALAATAAPDEYAALLADAGLAVQDRAPMTPVVKLVFGADYDKTRLAEYAAVLGHAHRVHLAPGSLESYLDAVPGGLKALVAEERRLRRGETGPAAVRTAPRPALARKLRQLQGQDFAWLPATGPEFTLLVARRLPDGKVVLLGEVGDDLASLERCARRLV